MATTTSAAIIVPCKFVNRRDAETQSFARRRLARD